MGVNAEDGAVDLAAEFDRAAAMRRLGRWTEALAGYDAVLRVQPGHTPSLNNRGIVLARLGRPDEALVSFDAALAANPSDPLALNNKGETLQTLARPREALAALDAAIAQAPDFAEAHGNRGHVLAQLGRTGEAVRALERAIELRPTVPRFYQHLAPLRRFTPEDPVLEQMQRLDARAGELSEGGRIELGFALAKALADIGEPDRAFEQLSRANRLKRSTFRYDEGVFLGELERVGALFGEDFQARMQGAGDPDPTPILVVGMPRSGSTLVEQILASHPKVFGAGEPPDLAEVIQESLARAGVDGFPDGAARLGRGAVLAIGQAYVQRLRCKSPDAERIVDKTLSNHRFIGLVHAALPNARIVHMRRDPVDTCVSCYSLLFGGDQPFAYDLGELGRYHQAVDRLMRRWVELLGPDVVLELDYETLIADPESQVRRLLEHCGLEWDPRCLEFHRTEREVRTSSAAQVRRPLYGDSVGGARVFERHLGPLLEALGRGAQATSDVQPAVIGGQRPTELESMALTDLERKAASGDVVAQRALATDLDAHGRHVEAVDWLARAANAGDVDALTVLGQRFLVGRNAPFLPLEGARLLSNAAGAGSSEATASLAVLIGGGIYARQNWSVALDCLQRSAELGSESSRNQLKILAGVAGEPASDDWRRLRSVVDIAYWTGPTPSETLVASPQIRTVQELIPPEACEWVIEQARSRLVRAELYDPATGKPVLGTETRLNQIANFNLADTCLLNILIQAKISAAAGFPFQQAEAFAVLHYAPGEEYGEHVDYLDPAIPAYAREIAQAGQRVATCLIYLSDDYEGGETEFPQLGVSFKGERGDALIFFSGDPKTGRPDPRTVHAGRPPASGEKWLLSQFFRNRPAVGVEARRS